MQLIKTGGCFVGHATKTGGCFVDLDTNFLYWLITETLFFSVNAEQKDAANMYEVSPRLVDKHE